MKHLRIAAVLFLAALAPAAAQAPVAALVNIGVAAAVHGAVRAAAPGAVGRVVASGKPVYLNDHVTTGPDGRLQILLLDETTFTLGPKSDMVLDEFVYDPKTGDGKVSAKIESGAFRFVTGRVARKTPENMKVALPVGTIGIRGTMVAGRVDGRDAEVVLVGPGPENNAQERRGGIVVSNALGSTEINASGYGTTISGGGKPSAGFRFDAGRLGGILDDLESPRTAGKGGLPDAARSSGDVLARGGINYSQFQNLTAVSQDLGQTTSFASQQAGSVVNDWSDILAIQSGQAGYQGSGNYTCSGPDCVSVLGGNTGTYNYGFNVDFGARTIGGNGSNITINGGTGDSAFLSTAVSYAGRSGPATYTFGATDGAGTSGGSFAGSTLTFLRANGQNAGAMQVNLQYALPSGSNGTATGSSSAPKGAPFNGG